MMTSSPNFETPEEAVRALREYLQVEASRVAVGALVEVAQDRKATAQARATAGAALLRAAGFFDRTQEGAGKKEPHEMSAEELAAEVERVSRRLRRRDEPGDLFD